MTLEELANKETELYSKILVIYHRPNSVESNKKLNEIFLDYKKVHQQYADLSSSNIEALKRGLFIQWYFLSEPNYLTGISNLDKEAENAIIRNLNNLIAANRVDSELAWMLNYYSNWIWIFERLNEFKGFDKKIINENNSKLPRTIDREAMKLRGQMGRYWNSLSIFEKQMD